MSLGLNECLYWKNANGLFLNVGNMMQIVFLDGNPLDEDDGNLLDEVVLDA